MIKVSFTIAVMRQRGTGSLKHHVVLIQGQQDNLGEEEVVIFIRRLDTNLCLKIHAGRVRQRPRDSQVIRRNGDGSAIHKAEADGIVVVGQIYRRDDGLNTLSWGKPLHLSWGDG